MKDRSPHLRTGIRKLLLTRRAFVIAFVILAALAPAVTRAAVTVYFTDVAATAATTLTPSPATGTYGGPTTPSAHLTSGGSDVPNEQISFTLNGNLVGSATTNAAGVATLNNASLAGIDAGSYPAGVGASFAGDAGFDPSSGSNSLTVAKADQTISVTTHAPASAAYNRQFTVAATGGGSGNPVTFSSSGAGTGTVSSAPSFTAGSAEVVYPLRVSANGRYLVDQNDRPFLMAGESPQALIGNLSIQDATTFFADRKARGFNAEWINLLCATYSACNSNGTTFDGIKPFTTGDSVDGYDLATPNPEFFQRVDDMINLAAQYEQLVVLDPIETGGWLQTLRNNGLTKAFNYGAYLGNRYKNFPNIIWMSGNDFQSWQNETDANLVFAVMQGIHSTDTNHLQTVELSFNVSSSFDSPILSQLSNLNASYTYYPTYAEVLRAYRNSPTQPVFMVEANYEGENNTGQDPSTPKVLRQQEYWTMLSGATGQLFGNHYTWQFAADWKSNLDTSGVTQFGYATNLLRSFPWYDLVPDQTHVVLTAGYGTAASSGPLHTNDYATAARTPSGSLALVFMPTSRTITIDMTKFAGSVTAKWFDPTSNTFSTVSGSPFPNAGSRQFTPPSNNAEGSDDWLLVLETSNACSNTGATFTMTSGTGTCSVRYDQAGDGNYNPAPQVTETVNAQKADQSIDVTTHAPGSAAFNQQFTVAATGGGSGNPVTFSSSGSCSNTGATFTITASSGTCSVRYDQAGNADYSVAPQVVETVTARKADQTITIAQHAPASSVFNTSFTVAATGGASGNPVVVSTSGACSNTGASVTMTSGIGVCSVMFDEAGDADYNPAPQVVETTNATKAAQAINVTQHAPASAIFNTQFSVAATGGASGNPITTSSTGVCSNTGPTFAMTSGTGTCTVHYNQAGDANYAAAPEVTEAVNAQRADQTITVTQHAPSTAVFNTSFSVAGNGPGGVVTFTSGGACSNNGSTFTMTSGTGTCTVNFVQGGDANYKPAPQVTESVTPQKAGQTISVLTHAPASAVYETNFAVAAVGVSSGNPVTYSSAGACTNLAGTFAMTSGTGTCTVSYDQAGDANYAAAPQVTETVNAQKADQTISFGPLPDGTVGDPDFTVSATASSGLAVSFSASGQCTVTGTTVHLTGAAGSCTITASQGGNANFTAAADVPQTFSITTSGGDSVNPTVTIVKPDDGASYSLGTVLKANFKCKDKQSGIATCVGTVANGAKVDTSTIATHAFTVTATDNDGNTTTLTVLYTVV